MTGRLAGFARIPGEAWTQAPIDRSARAYDAVGRHGWYDNLNPTVDLVADQVRDDDVLVDYSGGTGIFVAKLLERMPRLAASIVIVDASPKFLRLALEKFRPDDRVSFRLLKQRAGSAGLSSLPETAPELIGNADMIVCTNAIHLYPDLAAVARSWTACLRPEGRLVVQSGNIALDEGTWRGLGGPWIIEDTVSAVQESAAGLVGTQARFARFRDALSDPRRMAAHQRLRAQYFLPKRPLSAYLDAFAGAGLEDVRVERRVVAAKTADWFEFLSVYHEGVLGWAGGAEKVEGRPPDPSDVQCRLDLLREALDLVVGGPEFKAAWTYITARRAGT